MKRISLLAALLTVSAGTLTAQSVQMGTRMGSGASITPVPKEVSKDSKAYLAIIEFDGDGSKSSIDLYQQPNPGNPDIHIAIPLQESSDSYYEKATNVSKTISFGNSWNQQLGDKQSFSSKDDIETYLKEAYQADITLNEFTTVEGINAYCINLDAFKEEPDFEEYCKSYYWNYSRYQFQYPSSFWFIDDEGRLFEYNVGYEEDYDFSSATWTKDLEYSQDCGYDPYELYLAGFTYQNVDQSFYPTTDIVASQNIFNNDANWEYIVFDFELEANPYQPWYDEEDQVARREVYQSRTYKGMKIMSSTGAMLAYIEAPDERGEKTLGVEINSVAVVNNLVYILTMEWIRKGEGYSSERRKEGLYIIDPTTTQVMSASRAPARMAINQTVIEKGNDLSISVSDPSQNDRITISSMAGQSLKTAGASNGNVQVETGSMPKGIYNVTLHGNSVPAENQRIIIK